MLFVLFSCLGAIKSLCYVMLCYVKKTKSVVVYCVLTGLIQTHKSLRDGLVLYGGHVQKRWCNGKSTEEKGTRKQNLYASRVRTSAIRTIEPAAQFYGQTEQVYRHNCTYSFLSIGHKIAAHATGECAHDK